VPARFGFFSSTSASRGTGAIRCTAAHTIANAVMQAAPGIPDDHTVLVLYGDVPLISPATLNMTVKTDSLEETGADFTAEQKGIIKKELNEIVMESAKYPDMTFHSTEVSGALNGAAFDAKIGGDLTLHGVTKHIMIPATVTFDGDTLRAKGEFKLNRKDFNVNATDAFHGFVRVKHDVKFTFDIAAHKV